MVKSGMSIKAKIGYGVCDLGGNLFFTAIGLWLMIYLTDTVGIAAGLAGIVVAIGKIWDAITDPLAGFLSDRTKTRWGRRRPWMLFGSFPLFVAMVVMFTNPNLSSQAALFAWGTLAFCFLNTAYTAVNIPYNSLTPELTQDYHERTSLNGFRFGFAVVGTLLGAGLALPIVGLFSTKSAGFAAMGTIFGAAMLITALITFFSVREPVTERQPFTRGFFETYRKVFRNKPYLLILGAYALHVTGLTIVMSVAAYYFKYIHHDEQMTTTAMLVLLVTAFAFIPVSVILSKKFGKKIVYGAGLLIFAANVMVMFFLGHLYPVTFSIALMFTAGIGLGFTYVMPWAMVPDAVEYDYLLSGERTEGAFYGIWTFGIKIGQAISLAITGAVLSLSGYVPEAAQTPDALLGIRLLVGPITAVIFIAGAVVLYRYPINEKRYNEILDQIKEMEKRK
ncbi:MAG TPA: MFS transporter [Spirochaetota bacterium]|nr:MFS transporter [Spirochaetota bacterium]HPV39544.1 MFS transporter [Spirochaetota bacterium]